MQLTQVCVHYQAQNVTKPTKLVFLGWELDPGHSWTSGANKSSPPCSLLASVVRYQAQNGTKPIKLVFLGWELGPGLPVSSGANKSSPPCSLLASVVRYQAQNGTKPIKLFSWAGSSIPDFQSQEKQSSLQLTNFCDPLSSSKWDKTCNNVFPGLGARSWTAIKAIKLKTGQNL